MSTPQAKAAAQDAATRRWLAATITTHQKSPSKLSLEIGRSKEWLPRLLDGRTRMTSQSLATVAAHLGVRAWPLPVRKLVLIEGDRELLRELAAGRRSRGWVRHHHTAFRLTRLLVQELVSDDGRHVEITEAGRALIAQPEEAPCPAP